jgi:hypothetical protein
MQNLEDADTELGLAGNNMAGVGCLVCDDEDVDCDTCEGRSRVVYDFLTGDPSSEPELPGALPRRLASGTSNPFTKEDK